mmetsp:Transcript_21310/g.27708  ORF Transcript_21310/g.27708 Transcript_21310/m.27708 type:complete len:218 (-) Transcript_21310:1207-1860(-)
MSRGRPVTVNPSSSSRSKPSPSGRAPMTFDTGDGFARPPPHNRQHKNIKDSEVRRYTRASFDSLSSTDNTSSAGTPDLAIPLHNGSLSVAISSSISLYCDGSSRFEKGSLEVKSIGKVSAAAAAAPASFVFFFLFCLLLDIVFGEVFLTVVATSFSSPEEESSISITTFLKPSELFTISSFFSSLTSSLPCEDFDFNKVLFSFLSFFEEDGLLKPCI